MRRSLGRCWWCGGVWRAVEVRGDLLLLLEEEGGAGNEGVELGAADVGVAFRSSDVFSPTGKPGEEKRNLSMMGS